MVAGRWVAVLLEDEHFARAFVASTIPEILDSERNLKMLGVDIPIGMPKGKQHRVCDVAAKKLIGPRSSSVFHTPPREILEAPTYREANFLSRRRYNRGISAQAYALGPKILEIDPIAASDDRLIEAHPEVCFWAMKRGHLAHPKKSWNGQMERRFLLTAQGIELPDEIPALANTPPDDLLDAAAAAWTAHRVAIGAAQRLPSLDDAADLKRRRVIWY